MKYSVLLMLFAIVTFSGCVTKFKPYPVPCKVPVSKCATADQMSKMSHIDIIIEMRRCIEEHKENEKVCQ